MRELVLLCRPGFEAECAQETGAWAAAAQVAGRALTERGSALVRYVFDATPRIDAPHWRDLIFARQVLAGAADLPGLDPRNRLDPVMRAIEPLALRYADVQVELPDSPAGAELKALARGLEAAALALCRKRGLIDQASPRRLHLCLLSGTHLVVAHGDIARTAPWPGGIPRLKFPREAPSRSTLKLEEAFLTLLDDREREELLRAGMTAVDLGAAPGGWTYQLVRRSIRVTAVDNGPMDRALMDSGLVEHRREDGFRFRPRKPVDWLVCDMVEQPVRIATLIAQWLAGGHARAAVFNLKLPMKKRWDEVQRCLGLVGDAIGVAPPVGAASAATRPTNRPHWSLRAKQLYHDREEITLAAIPVQIPRPRRLPRNPLRAVR